MNKKCTASKTLAAPSTIDLWDTFHEGIRGFVTKRVSMSADAEDIVQEIFLRIHMGIPGVKHIDHVQAWVYAIARRAVADFYRSCNQKYQDRRTLSIDTFNLGKALPLSAKVELHEGVHDVHEEVISWLRPMMEKLPEKYRVPLLLADVEGLRQQDVALHLGLSLSGAKSRVQRARKMLGEVLRTCCDIEFGIDGRAISYQKHQSLR